MTASLGMALLAACALVTPPASAGAGGVVFPQVKVIAVEDGDTVKILDPAGPREVKVRLASIDAPEMRHGAKRPGQPFSQASRQTLAQMVFGRLIRAECPDVDRYGRMVCTLIVPADGGAALNVNLAMVAEGYAWANTARREYVRDPRVLAAQARARQLRAGLWSEPGAIEPWDWRKLCWEQGQCTGAAQ